MMRIPAFALAALMLMGCANDDPGPTLGPEVMIASAGASNPTTAVDATRQLYHVAWVGTYGPESNVYLARSEDGAAFGEPVRVNHVAGDAAPHEQAPAQVAVGSEGNVYVLWQNNTHAEGRRFPYSDLRFARSTDGGRTFEPAIAVNDDAGGPPSSHTFHNLTVAADNSVFVSWIDGRMSAHAGMHEVNQTGPEIRVARSTDGGRTFGPSVVVAANACPCCRTALATASDGTLYVAWRDVGDGNIRDVVVARSSDGGATWSSPTFVHRDAWRIEGCPHAGPALAVDAKDRLHVGWYTGAEGRVGIYYSLSQDGGRTFGEPAPVMVGDWVPISQVRLAAEGDEVMIAWDDRRNDDPSIRTARSRGGLVIKDEVDTGLGTSPALSARARLHAIAWLRGDTVLFRPGNERS
ncbi:MAG: sialidase family protein, partial [Longimicrobiales bacterium]